MDCSVKYRICTVLLSTSPRPCFTMLTTSSSFIDATAYTMIGLKKFLQNLKSSSQKSFIFYLDFQQWMQGTGFDRQTGSLAVDTSSFWRAFRKFVQGKDAKWFITVMGPSGGKPPELTAFKAIVVVVEFDNGAINAKPLYGIRWRSRHIIVTRHHRLMASLAHHI